jgi:hypothetical protein
MCTYALSGVERRGNVASTLEMSSQSRIKIDIFIPSTTQLHYSIIVSQSQANTALSRAYSKTPVPGVVLFCVLTRVVFNFGVRTILSRDGLRTCGTSMCATALKLFLSRGCLGLRNMWWGRRSGCRRGGCVAVVHCGVMGYCGDGLGDRYKLLMVQ